MILLCGSGGGGGGRGDPASIPNGSMVSGTAEAQNTIEWRIETRFYLFILNRGGRYK